MSTKNNFLALGDSYTIGESVGETERWPVQLTLRLRDEAVFIEEPTILAETGWTTSELHAGIIDRSLENDYDLVSLQIGVNNQYRGLPIENYRTEFRNLLLTSIKCARNDPGRVIVLSIPDWGMTPFAEAEDREQIRCEINRLNTVNRSEAETGHVRYIDVTAISRLACENPSLIASDGLHPSGRMYSMWVELLVPHALSALRGNQHEI